MPRSDDAATPPHYAGSGTTCDEALASMLVAPANAEVPPMALFWWATAFKYVWRMFAKGQGEGRLREGARLPAQAR